MAADLNTDGLGNPIRHKRTTNFNQIVHNYYASCPHFYHEIPIFGVMCPSCLFSGVGTYDSLTCGLELEAVASPNFHFDPIYSLCYAHQSDGQPTLITWQLLEFRCVV